MYQYKHMLVADALMLRRDELEDRLFECRKLLNTELSIAARTIEEARERNLKEEINQVLMLWNDIKDNPLTWEDFCRLFEVFYDNLV